MNDITKLILMVLLYGIMLWIALGVSAWLANHFPNDLVINRPKTNTVKPLKTITAVQNYHKRAA
jgi:hypothetical protein